jgi:hypothetical protein
MPPLRIVKGLLLAAFVFCAAAMRPAHYNAKTPGDHSLLAPTLRSLIRDPAHLRPILRDTGVSVAMAALGQGDRVVDCTHTIKPSTFSFAAHADFFESEKVR